MGSEKTASPRVVTPVPRPLASSTSRYSSFSRRQKRAILGLAAFAGWFSSVSSFIYFPAIPALAASLGQSTERINLTVTSYLVVSGVVPSVVGNAADRFGRRPVVLVALTVYLGANVGLALQSSFALLFFFRMVQSAGVSGTFCITYGVLSDLFTPAERGGYAGIVSLLLNTPPSLGPLLSGLLLLQWSWRSIFWFLSIATPCCLLPMLLLFPETARNIVGDGTKRPSSIVNRPVLPWLVSFQSKLKSKSSAENSDDAAVVVVIEPREPSDEETLTTATAKKRIVNPLAALKLIRSPATALILVNYGVGYATYSCLQASLSTLFLQLYDISGLASGLIYIPFGIGCALAAFGTGRLLDHNYQKTAAEVGIVSSSTSTANTTTNTRTRVVVVDDDDDMAHFPIEKARLRTITWSVVLCASLTASYGWQLQTASNPSSMAGALVTQFFMGLTLQPMFTALNTLLVDLHRDEPSTAQAACNLVRCELAAAALAALDPLLQPAALGPGWTFVLFAAALYVSALLLLLLQCQGWKWRQKKCRVPAGAGATGSAVVVDTEV